MDKVKDFSKKWLTRVKYFDVETGDEITKKEFKQKYIKLRTIKHIFEDGSYNIREFWHECRTSKQLRLF